VLPGQTAIACLVLAIIAGFALTGLHRLAGPGTFAGPAALFFAGGTAVLLLARWVCAEFLESCAGFFWCIPLLIRVLRYISEEVN
jgi:hypothetical protein